MTDDPIELLRAHVARHSIKDSAFFSIKGLTVLLDELDRWKAHAIGLEHKVSTQARQLEEFVERDADDAIELRRQRDEARQTLSDWTTDIGVRGFARRSELDAAKAEVETLTKQRDELNFQIEHLEACVTIHDRNRKELKAQLDAFYEAGQQMTAQRNALKAQVERLLAARSAVLTEALRRNGYAGNEPTTQPKETEK